MAADGGGGRPRRKSSHTCKVWRPRVEIEHFMTRWASRTFVNAAALLKDFPEPTDAEIASEQRELCERYRRSS